MKPARNNIFLPRHQRNDAFLRFTHLASPSCFQASAGILSQPSKSRSFQFQGKGNDAAGDSENLSRATRAPFSIQTRKEVGGTGWCGAGSDAILLHLETKNGTQTLAHIQHNTTTTAFISQQPKVNMKSNTTVSETSMQWFQVALLHRT